MLYSFKGKLADGSTMSGTASGANPVEAAADSITKTGADASAIVRLTLAAITGANVKVRAPKKKKGETANGAAPAAETSAPARGRSR